MKFSEIQKTIIQLESWQPLSLRIWSQLLKKSLTKNFIFCAVQNVHLINSSKITKEVMLSQFQVKSEVFAYNRGIFETLSNIENGAFCKNGSWLSAFANAPPLDLSQGSECASAYQSNIKWLVIYFFPSSNEFFSLYRYSFSYVYKMKERQLNSCLSRQ